MRRYMLKVGCYSERGLYALETVVAPALRLAFEEVKTDDGATFIIPEDKREQVEQFINDMELYQDCNFPRSWQEMN